MQVPDIFKILADYLEFACDLLACRGLEPYARKGVIDPQLVAYCVTGVALAYLLSSAKKIPGYEQQVVEKRARAGQPKAKPNRRPWAAGMGTGSDMVIFVLCLFLGAAVVHPFLVLVNGWVGSGELGTVKDTINAGLAFGAVWHPIRALLLRGEVTLLSGIEAGRIRPTSGRGLLLIGAAAQLGLFFHWATALAAMHVQGRGSMFWVAALATVLFFVVLFSCVAIVMRLDDDEGSAPCDEDVAVAGSK